MPYMIQIFEFIYDSRDFAILQIQELGKTMKICKIFLKHVTENCVTLTKNMQYKLMSPRYLPGLSKSSKNRNLLQELLQLYQLNCKSLCLE